METNDNLDADASQSDGETLVDSDIELMDDQRNESE